MFGFNFTHLFAKLSRPGDIEVTFYGLWVSLLRCYRLSNNSIVEASS